MADLIRRADAIRETWKESTYSDPLNVLTEMRDRLEALPSAESHTIYCKDCKFSSYEPDGKSADVYVCNYSRWRRSEGGLFPDDFCSRAEEREDG